MSHFVQDRDKVAFLLLCRASSLSPAGSWLCKRFVRPADPEGLRAYSIFGAKITSGSGDDAIFLKGPGGEGQFEQMILDIPNMPQEFFFFEGKLQIDVGGVQYEWVDIDYNGYKTSREDIRAAVIKAIESNTALDNMVEVRELTDGTLEMRSLTGYSFAKISG